jgi:hypothetical protein
MRIYKNHAGLLLTLLVGYCNTFLCTILVDIPVQFFPHATPGSPPPPAVNGADSPTQRNYRQIGHSLLRPNVLFVAPVPTRDFMASRFPMQLCSRNLLVCLVTLTLLLAGTRVPDLSRPHRPKPSQRAVVTSQLKSAPEACKQQLDHLVAIIETAVRLAPPIVLATLVPPFFAANPCATSFCNSGRSPPATGI